MAYSWRLRHPAQDFAYRSSGFRPGIRHVLEASHDQGSVHPAAWSHSRGHAHPLPCSRICRRRRNLVGYRACTAVLRRSPPPRAGRSLPSTITLRVNGGGAVAASREVQIGRFSPTINVSLNLALSGQADLQFIAPTYTFAEPVLGGQLSATMAGVWGRNSASIAGTLTGPLGNTFQGSLQDALVSYGDLYPTLKLKWNQGATTSWCTAPATFPVKTRYDPSRLRQYRHRSRRHQLRRRLYVPEPNDRHRIFRRRRLHVQFQESRYAISKRYRFSFDRGVSHFMSKQVFVGFVGYAYQQVTNDFGQPAVLGGFRSRVLGIGPRLKGVRFQDWRQFGISGSEGLWRVRRRQSPFGLEHVVDILDLGGGAQRRGTDQTSRDQVVD